MGSSRSLERSTVSDHPTTRAGGQAAHPLGLLLAQPQAPQSSRTNDQPPRSTNKGGPEWALLRSAKAR